MEDLSEEHFYASWLIDLEYILWGIVQEGVRHNTFFDNCIEVETLDELRRLANEAGGWWVWDDHDMPDGTHETTRFVPMDEWLKMHEAHGQERSP